MFKRFKNFIISIFGTSNDNVVVTEPEVKSESTTSCEHKFGRYKFAKGGGREAVCKICGYVKHID